MKADDQNDKSAAKDLSGNLHRKRLTPSESRELAIEAARHILLTDGANAVTLKSVALRVGRTHANVLHHFGSAQNLQTALAANICERVGAMAERALQDFWEQGRSIEETAEKLSHLIFDAFDSEGGAQVCLWVFSHDDGDAIELLLAPLTALAKKLMPFSEPVHLQRTLLKLSLMALSNAMLGKQLAKCLDLAEDEPRLQAKQILIQRLESMSMQPR